MLSISLSKATLNKIFRGWVDVISCQFAKLSETDVITRGNYWYFIGLKSGSSPFSIKLCQSLFFLYNTHIFSTFVVFLFFANSTIFEYTLFLFIINLNLFKLIKLSFFTTYIPERIQLQFQLLLCSQCSHSCVVSSHNNSMLEKANLLLG